MVHCRRCMVCGFDGPELQGDRGRLVFSCPSCAADLYARPAMSYAEMEGLAVEPVGVLAWCRRVLHRTRHLLVREPLRLEGVPGEPVRRRAMEPNR